MKQLSGVEFSPLEPNVDSQKVSELGAAWISYVWIRAAQLVAVIWFMLMWAHFFSFGKNQCGITTFFLRYILLEKCYEDETKKLQLKPEVPLKRLAIQASISPLHFIFPERWLRILNGNYPEKNMWFSHCRSHIHICPTKIILRFNLKYTSKFILFLIYLA